MTINQSKKIFHFLMLCSLFYSASIFANEKSINLVVSYKYVHFAGKRMPAIAVNQQIPGPTLHFKEGDTVTINVTNHLDKPTAIHWHGLLVPWQMDGVVGVSQKGILPGQSFQYQFTLQQSGTYWYHAHATLQEQSGLYGAIIIDPIKPSAYQYNRDEVIVLSDWSNTEPDQILANLKKDGSYYSPRFPLQPSLSKFIRDYGHASPDEKKNIIDDYRMMQDMRMSIYDFSDVAYDAFLLNGKPNAYPWVKKVDVGDTVRLRFIGAGGSTIFRVKIPGSTMKMVHIQGNDIVPYDVDYFWIAPGETYDVLVHIVEPKPYIIYAESIDQIGAALGALVTDLSAPISFDSIQPFPEPKPVMRKMMTLMMSRSKEGHKGHGLEKSFETVRPEEDAKHPSRRAALQPPSFETAASQPPQDERMSTHHEHSAHANHMAHQMQTEASIIGDNITSPISTDMTTQTNETQYQQVRSYYPTNDPDKPIDGIIKMELFGYMDRFIWFINGLPEYKAKPIILEPNKRYRFIFTNPSMMRHPMHIHGHWFILRNGNGRYDPLLHTIDVEPGATVVADVDADASGQWLFHCHLLYHMMAGMTRVFQYSTLLELEKQEIVIRPFALRRPQSGRLEGHSISNKPIPKPEDTIQKLPYHNRAIVRVDEVVPISRSLVMHPSPHGHPFWYANLLSLSADPFHNVQQLTFKGLYGSDYHKLELFINDAEMDHSKVETADIDIFYWHLLTQFWAVKGGLNYTYRPAQTPYWQPGIGIEGLMPYFIETDLRTYYHQGAFKLDLELSRDTQITNNFFVGLGIRSILASKTVAKAGIGSGLNQMRYTLTPYYRLSPGVNLFLELEHQRNYGAFRKLERKDESSSQNTVSLGLSVLF